jgi:hypothetical protein
VKIAVVEPAATVTVAGTVTAALLLATPTVNPPLAAAAFNVRVQLSVPAALNDPVLQLRPLSTGTPVPLRLIRVEVPLAELLVSVNCPVAAPAVLGSNCTVSVAVWFGFSVSGKLTPETVNPVPATLAALTVTADVPVEDRVSVWLAAEFTLAFPNDRLDELTPSPIEAAPNCTPADMEIPVELAETVTACAVLTAETVAAKLPLVAPAGNVIEAGTTNDELLLFRLTFRPPVGTARLVATVQLSVPAPVTVWEAQLNCDSLGTPRPCSPILHEAPVDALLVIERFPVAAPVTVGSNCRVSVAV